jgi:prepilin-type processing-associated H-X9-DG protein
VRYYLNLSGGVEGGRKMNTIQRVSQIWLIGDVGDPKSGGNLNTLPASYYTDITVIKPVITPPPGSGWTTVPSYKQAACRHNGLANYSACDGHVEAGKWANLVVDANDVFAINSF